MGVGARHAGRRRTSRRSAACRTSTFSAPACSPRWHADRDLRVDLPDHEQDDVGAELRGHALDAADDPPPRVRGAVLGGVPHRTVATIFLRRPRHRSECLARRWRSSPSRVRADRPRLQLVPDRVHGHAQTQRRRLQCGLPLRHQPAVPVQRHVLSALPAARPDRADRVAHAAVPRRGARARADPRIRSNWATAPIHLGYLLAMLAIGVALADRFLRRRMAG